MTDLALGKGPAAVAADLARDAQVPLQRALVIARDQMLDAYRTAALDTYRANSSVVQQWMWVADQSANTCAACIFMDGSLHTLDEEMDSHVCCRCSPVPVTRSWADILGGMGLDGSAIPETSLSASSRQAGAAWFDQQAASVQDSILGVAGGKAYRAGDVSLADFVGHTTNPVWGGSYQQVSLKTAMAHAASK